MNGLGEYRKWLALCAGVCVVAISSYAQLRNLDSARAESSLTRDHGYQLNEQYRLLIEQADNTLDIVLIKRNRAESGGLVPNVVTGEETVARYAEKRTLARVRSEVLKPAAPNYLSNPGERYRITLQGVDFEPEYKSVVEVHAANAIKAWQREFEKLSARAQGIEREALVHGAGLALGVLNVGGHMPATIPLTVLESGAGTLRGFAQLERRSLGARSAMSDARIPRMPPRPGAGSERGAGPGGRP